MRFTVEPTTKEQTSGNAPIDAQYPTKIVIEYPYDHMDLASWLEVFRTIMRNIGFTEEQVESLELKEYK